MADKIHRFQILLCITYFCVAFLSTNCGKPVDKPVDKQVFRMNLDAGLSTLDPAYARDQASGWMTSQLFNGLVQLDKELRVLPSLASSWNISSDGLTYSFTLRQDVSFHPDPCFAPASTRHVKAQDVLYSFTRICNPQTASSGLWVFKGKIQGLEAYQKGEKTHIQGFEAPNDSTFLIHLTQPFPPFLGLLAMPYGFVLPREAVEAYGEDFRSHPIGTGPFKFFRWEENAHLILHRNPNYFEQAGNTSLPYLDAVRVSFIPSRLSAFIEFVQGKLDMINALDESYKDEILHPDGSIKSPYKEQYTFLMAPQLNTEYLGIQVDSSLASEHPLYHPKVRQALNYAIDRPRMVKYLLNGMGYAAESGFVPKGMPSHDPEKVEGFTFDPNRARSLLEEAGYPGGKGLPEITLYSTPKYANISEFIQKSLENIGVKLSIQNLQGGALRKEIYGANIHFWRASWIADYPDAENYLALFYSPNHSPSGPNTTHFRLPEYDDLYQQAMNISTDSLRYSLYQEMDRLMLESAPIIPLFYDRSLRIIQPNIQGLYSNPMNFLSLKRVRKSFKPQAISYK